MRNEEVIMAWVNGRSANNGRGSLTTDGVKLLSYDLVIGDNLQKVVFDYTSSGEYYSQTTSCHVGLALGISNYRLSPCPSQAELRLWKSSPRPYGSNQGPCSPNSK